MDQELLYTQFIPGLWLLALKLSRGDKQAAEDLLQDVAENMVRAKITDKPYVEQKKICYVALYNRFRDRYRVQHRKNKAMFDSRPYSMENPACYGIMAYKEMMAQVPLLHIKQQIAFLAQCLGYTMGEIAVLTKFPTVNNACANTRYARKHIRNALSDDFFVP